MSYIVFPQYPPVDPLWNLLKTVEDKERFHRQAIFYTGFAQLFTQPYREFKAVFSTR